MKVTDKSRQELFELYNGRRECMPKLARIKELELFRVMTEILRKMYRVEKLVYPNKEIRKYPRFIHVYDILQGGYQKGMEDFPEVLVTNDGFEFRTEWFDLDIHEYFEELKDETLWEMIKEMDVLRTQLKQKKKDFDKLGTMALDIDVVNATKKIN